MLISEHLHLVRMIAGRAARRLPACIDMDEMVAAGNLGLVEAALRYDRGLHPNFAVYCRWRIWGAIVDSFRGSQYPRLYTTLYSEGDRVCYDDPDTPFADLPGIVSEPVDPAPSIEAVLIEEQERQATVVDIRKAKRVLTPEQRRAVTDHAKGKTMRQIGAGHRRSGSWAHYTIHEARRRLRERLGPERDAA
jgi:RNA polymerase sigma factor (sigma-70 family)